tara:strand:+ start:197 stop:556 length:360 start_codon:yes stop_codon:yes gene_type:complete
MEKSKIIGEVIAKWLPDGRKMEIQSGITFRDKDGVMWGSYHGDTVDGSSIPRVLWSIIGSPFVGKHRIASVLHDIECQSKSMPYKQVHRMYYDVCIACGVNKYKAKAMYLGLKIGAPRW